MHRVIVEFAGNLLLKAIIIISAPHPQYIIQTGLVIKQFTCAPCKIVLTTNIRFFDA